MVNDHFHYVFSTQKRDIALPVIPVKSDNMLDKIRFYEFDVVGIVSVQSRSRMVSYS